MIVSYIINSKYSFPFTDLQIVHSSNFILNRTSKNVILELFLRKSDALINYPNYNLVRKYDCHSNIW